MESDMNSDISFTTNKPFHQMCDGKLSKKMIKDKTYPYLNIGLKIKDSEELLEISPSLSYLALGRGRYIYQTAASEVQIFDIKKSRIHFSIPIPGKCYDNLKVCFSFDEKYIVKLGGVLQIWDLKNKRLDFIIPYYVWIISCSNYNFGYIKVPDKIHIWSLTERSCTFEVFMKNPSSICFSPDSQLVAISSDLGNLNIINMKNEIIVSLEAHQKISEIIFSQNSEIFIYNLEDEYLIIHHIKSKNEICRLNCSNTFWKSISLSHDGDLLAYNSFPNSVYFIKNFSQNKMQKFQKWESQNEEIIGFRKSYLLLRNKSESSRLIDIRMMREQYVLVNKTKATSLAFSPDCNWLAIGMNNRVKMTCISDNKKNWGIEIGLKSWGMVKIKSLKFSADSKFLGIWSYPHLNVWNVVQKYSVIQVLSWHTRFIFSCQNVYGQLNIIKKMF